MVAITHRINYLFFVGNDPDGNLGLQSEFPGRCPGLRYLTPSGAYFDSIHINPSVTKTDFTFRRTLKESNNTA